MAQLGGLRAIEEMHGNVEDEEARLQPLDALCQQAFLVVKHFFAEKVHREPHHGYHHAVRVLVLTQEIAGDSFSVDALIVALLHDVLDHKFDDVTQEEFDVLLDQLIGVEAASRREGICKAIEAVSFSKEKTKGMRWYEEHLSQEHWINVRNFVSDADKLEALGVVGAARCYACAEMFAERDGGPQDVESLMWHVVEHCHEKLFLLGKDYFRTATGTRLAAEKTEELKHVLVDHGVNPHTLEAKHRIVPNSAVEVVEAFLTDSDPAEFLEIGQKGMVATVEGGWALIDFEEIEKLQWVHLDTLRCVMFCVPVDEPHYRACTLQGMHTFPASVLEGNADATSKYLMRCDKIMNPTLWSAPAPEWMIEEGVQIKDLWLDRPEHNWSGMSGDEVFYVMIKNAHTERVRYLVNSPEDMRSIISGLEWATHEKARVESQHLPIPHGFFVSLQALQLCVGSDCQLQRGRDADGFPTSEVMARGELKFRRMYLDFHLPVFDVLPSANTVFRKGDIIYGGCREVSYRDIVVDEKSSYALLQRSLDDQNKLRYPVKVKCLRQNPMHKGVHFEEEVTLHPEFRFLGHRKGSGAKDEHELLPGLALNKRLVFEVKPNQMVLRNFPNAQFGGCRLDYDFFKVENLPRLFELGEKENPISRYSMRTNILGIARLRQLNEVDAHGQPLTDQEKHYVYDVDWFPKRTSKIANGDVMFLPRLPAETSPGVSQRFWNDADIREYAHEFPSVDTQKHPERCAICRDRVKDCVLDPCGCQLCYECLESHRNEQHTRNAPISCPFDRYPIRAVILHARP